MKIIVVKCILVNENCLFYFQNHSGIYTCFDPTIGSTSSRCAQRQRIVSTCDCSGSSAKLEGRELWLEKTSVAGEGRLRKPISDSLRVVLRVVLISNTERKRGK